MSVETMTFDCVEMKNRIQARRLVEFGARKGKFAPYLGFINARVAKLRLWEGLGRGTGKGKDLSRGWVKLCVPRTSQDDDRDVPSAQTGHPVRGAALVDGPAAAGQVSSAFSNALDLEALFSPHVLRASVGLA